MSRPTAEQMREVSWEDERATGARTRLMVHLPDEWPLWPVLPLKNRDERWAVGFLLGDQPGAGPLTVFVGTYFQDPGDLKTLTYQDAEAMTDAGWRVD